MLLAVLTSCARKQVVLTPIWEGDLYITEEGHICMTEEYMKEVLKARIEKEE